MTWNSEENERIERKINRNVYVQDLDESATKLVAAMIKSGTTALKSTELSLALAKRIMKFIYAEAERKFPGDASLASCIYNPDEFSAEREKKNKIEID